MLKFYYPAKSENIWHKSRYGERYRLDSLDRMLRLKDYVLSKPDTKIEIVDNTDDTILSLAHDEELVKSYKVGEPREIVESSGVLWQDDFYPWIVNKGWAHILAANEALQNGKAVALTDGGHHSEPQRGYGFGPVNNITIASEYIKNRGLVNKIAVLDLDVHYANGTHSQAKSRPWIFSGDIWRYKLDKWTLTENQDNIFSIKVESAQEYMEVLPKLLDKIADFGPDLIWCYLGMDVLDDDRMGGIQGFDESVLVKRSKIVGDFIAKNKIPTVISMGGGYINYSQTDDEIEIQKSRMSELFWDSIVDTLGAR